jgi:hypothetical protein
MPDRAGSQWERSLLGSCADRLWPYGEAHGATVCEAVLKSNKNDANDAEAICEAVTRSNMRFVPQKSV